MSTFYTGVDKERYDAGEKFLPQNRFLLDYTTPTTNVEEEVIPYGIPNTNAFTGAGGGGGNNVGPFDPYTAQLGVTNRSSIGNTGYIQGTEPEETYMNKIGGLIKTGIGMAIPGANFLMNMVPSREKRLSAADNAFIDQQLGIDEQNIHGFGNLTNQDRYGYNKDSMFGNYADVIAERVAIANARISEGKDLRDIDSYYLEKEKEQDEINKQVDFNDWMNQRITANKIRDLQAKGIDLYPDGKDIHGGDDTTTTTTTTTDQSGKGDGSGGSKFAGDSGAKAGTTGSWSPGGTYSAPEKSGYQQSKGSHHYADGGRIYLNLGGLARLL